MVRTKTLIRITNCCIIFFAGALLQARASSYNLGRITQAHGEITYLNFSPPHPISHIKENDQLQTEGSYLAHEDSYLTVLLFDGSWLRLSPKSKMAVEFEPIGRTLTIHLFTGSIKTLISTDQNDKKIEKIIIKSASSTYESVEGKFTVSRNPLADASSVYVEKGSVIAMQTGPADKRVMEFVHSREMTTIRDNDSEIESPRKMTEREIKFLHPSFYLKSTKRNI